MGAAAAGGLLPCESDRGARHEAFACTDECCGGSGRGALDETQPAPILMMDEEVVEEGALDASPRATLSKLVFIEMGISTASGASTTDGGSSNSERGGRTRTTAMSMFKTRGHAMLSVLPTRPRSEQVEAMRRTLAAASVQTSAWGRDGTKSVEHLCWETREQHGCILTTDAEHGLKRVTRLVKVKLLAEIYGVDHVLFSRMQFMHDGQIVERKQLPLTKLRWSTDARAETLEEDDTFYAEDCPLTESWKAGCKRTLEERLGLSPSWQNKHLIEDLEGYRYVVESDSMSDGFPGLATNYCIYEVAFRVRDPECAGVQCIGLPQGQEFATAEGDFNFNRQQDDSGLAIGTQLNIWTWLREASVKHGKLSSDRGNVHSTRLQAFRSEAQIPTDSVVTPMPSVMAPGGSVDAGPVRSGQSGSNGANSSNTADKSPQFEPEEAFLVRRVPLPSSIPSPGSSQKLGSTKSTLSSTASASTASARLSPAKLSQAPVGERAPNVRLWAAMQNKTTDWGLAKSIAKNILDPHYTLQRFYDDLRAFPELELYLLEAPPAGASSTATGPSAMTTGSGRSSGDEYQRTIGTFFAIYWLLRIDIDGMDGFCNGVDERWRPLRIADGSDQRVMFPDKRLAFRGGAQWDMFRRLLLDAGVIEERKVRTSRFMGSVEKECIAVNESRLVALLALTAVHDIMKMSVLLPTVQEEHSPYRGFSAGDTIGDHDQALAYVMEHYPDLLPSFRDLSAEEKRCLVFTQCNLCFNHGWFVQAEAPPGAMFTKFRETLIRDHKLEISKKDVALYFVHWLTDLAGAEPTPLAGCEKFATKFPLPVLNSFLRSFETVGRIVSQTETQVVEEYLKLRWTESVPEAGPLPTGASAVAKMRLRCMAQSNAGAILEGFDGLPEDDREMLSIEMSRTGCVGQSFSQELSPKVAAQQGPAFLIYYGPAFLQGLGNDPPQARLSVLAEIFRCARELWPASISKVNVSVTIRIDMVKSLGIAAIQDFAHKGELWLLVKHNDLEAFVERSSKKKLNRLIASGQEFQVLDLANGTGKIEKPLHVSQL